MAVPAQRLPYLGPSSGGDGAESTTTLTAVAKLPATPVSAPAYEVTGKVTTAQLLKLATALGAKGALTGNTGPTAEAWVMQSPSTWLTAEPSALGRWLFRQIPPSPLCAPEWADSWCLATPAATVTVTPATPATTTTTPPATATIPTATAESIARRTLSAAGMDLGPMRVKASVVDGGELVVFTPVYGGIPVTGLTAAVDVGDGGQVRQASGFLGTPTLIATYPLVTATTAVGRLDAGNVLPPLNVGDTTSVCGLVGSGCDPPPPPIPPAQIHSVQLTLAPAVPLATTGTAVLEPTFALDASDQVVPAAVDAALGEESLEGQPSRGPSAIGFSWSTGPEPAPADGNGFGPGGECTGRETVPPCGPGMVMDRYYSYSVPSVCGGKLVANGQLWAPELPLPPSMNRQTFWIALGASGTGGVMGPNGAVGFLPAPGSPATCTG
ncbi:MAG: hypothetical protein ACRDJU_10575 [Actinomycetota bacterium]